MKNENSLKRTHLGCKGIINLHDVQQTPFLQGFCLKPKGFWYSVDGDWERWCESEMPDWIKGKFVYSVELNGENILKLTTPIQIIDFDKKYSKKDTQLPLSSTGYPDWELLSKKYDGIEIAPYQWELRLRFDLLWYYTWDCASGCVWRPKGMKVKLI